VSCARKMKEVGSRGSDYEDCGDVGDLVMLAYETDPAI
jgi:hypothetical protein